MAQRSDYEPMPVPDTGNPALEAYLIDELRRLRDAVQEGANGWRDITSQITVRGVGANNPNWANIGGSFYGYNFDLTDEAFFSFHVPHDYQPGTDIHLHTHWLCKSTDTTNTVKWQFDYMYALGFDQEAYSTTGTTVYAEQASGAQLQHMIAESAAISIPTLTEPDGIIYVRVARIANGATDVANGQIFMLTSDVHYLSDSRATPGKAPDFYS
jgi:hypothetical protein